MYHWIVFLHIIGVFLFLISHGTSAAVAFKLRYETQRECIRTLLELSTYPLNVMWISLFSILIPGTVLGFMGRLWTKGWIWTSLRLLITMGVANFLLGSSDFNNIRQVVGSPGFDGRQEQPGVDPIPEREMAGLVSHFRPWILAGIGFGRVSLITWLMMFKPF